MIIYFSENNVINNCKKTKYSFNGYSFNGKSWEKESLAFCTVSNASIQQNRKISPIKIKICENKKSLKCINKLFNSSISEEKINSSNEFTRRWVLI